MGIFMITISQISSHTIVECTPHFPASSGHDGLQLSAHELMSFGVVLRQLERRAGALYIHPAPARHPHGQVSEHLVELDVAVLPHADPASVRDGLDKGVGEWSTLPIAAADVEPRVEQAPLRALAEDHVAPGRRALAGGVDAPVAGVHAGAVAIRERETLVVYSDAFDD